MAAYMPSNNVFRIITVTVTCSLVIDRGTDSCTFSAVSFTYVICKFYLRYFRPFGLSCIVLAPISLPDGISISVL